MESLIKQYKLFWQYPVITEKEFNLQNKDNPFFLGFPWATIIDKRYNLNIIYKILFPSIQKDRQYYTCCQHIHFRQLIPLFKSLNIHIVYSPHKIKDEDENNGIRILPCPLYAVNIEDESRNMVFKNVDFLGHKRKILYSFQGAYNEKWYLTDIRKKIFEMKHPEDCYIKYIGNWHFENVVYSSKQNKNYELNESDRNHVRTEKYNNLLLDSRYSICPSGSGPNSIRFWESLAVGSIPILLSDTLELPDNTLWKDAIITIPEKDVNLLPQIVSKIDTKRENTMRQNCIQLYSYYKNNYNNHVDRRMTLFIEMHPSLIQSYYKVFGHFFLDHLFMLYKIKYYYQTNKNIDIDSIYIDEKLLHIVPFIKPFYESIFRIYTTNEKNLNIFNVGSIIGSIHGSEESNIYLSKTILKSPIPNHILENGRKLSDFNRIMMQSFTRKVKEHFIEESKQISDDKVLIIDRQQSPRKLLHVEHVIDKLKERGFHCTKVTFDNIDLAQQIRMVSQYKNIICACGSVQVHISFLRKDCTFIELCESGFRYPNTSIYGNYNGILTYSLTTPLKEQYYDPKYKMNDMANKLFRGASEMPGVITNDMSSIEREKKFYSKLMSYNCFWIHTIQDIHCDDHIDNIMTLFS